MALSHKLNTLKYLFRPIQGCGNDSVYSDVVLLEINLISMKSKRKVHLEIMIYHIWIYNNI